METKDCLVDMGNCLARVNLWVNGYQGPVIGLVILQQGAFEESVGYQPPSEVYIDSIVGLRNLRDALIEKIEEFEGLTNDP